MDLNFTDSENTFRRECRAWLEANVPSEDEMSEVEDDVFRLVGHPYIPLELELSLEGELTVDPWRHVVT